MTRLASNILLFLQVDDLWIYTESETGGVIMDPCKGDSGGPLIIDNGGQPLLVGVLQVPLKLNLNMTFYINPGRRIRLCHKPNERRRKLE